MDEVEELNRKLKSQEETLSELVKKNLDLEMQINIKNFELRTIRGRWFLLQLFQYIYNDHC